MTFETYDNYHYPIVIDVNDNCIIGIYKPLIKGDSIISIYNKVSDSYILLYSNTYSNIYNKLNKVINKRKLKQKKEKTLKKLLGGHKKKNQLI